MIKIIQIVPTLGTHSGMMRFIMNYYNEINNKKFKFIFIYFHEVDNDFKDEILKLGGEFVKIPRPSFKSRKQIFKKLLHLKDEIDIAHCHPIFSSFIFYNVFKKLNIKRVIQHSHSTRFSNKKISSLRNYIISKFLYFTATDYVSCSEAAKSLFPRFIRNNKVKIIHNAIDLKKYQYNMEKRNNIREELKLPEKTLVFGTIGRLSSEKRHSLMIRLFKEIKSINNDTKLIIVGDGELKYQLKELVKELDLERDVLFTGIQNDIKGMLSSFDAFLLTSSFEGLGIVAVEAQTSNLPVFYCNLITKEAMILESTLAIECEYNLEKTARFILDNYHEKERVNISPDILNSHFNIKMEKTNLEIYYKELVGNT